MVSPMTGITDRVIEALLADPRTKDANIEVTSTGSIITLTGTVKSRAIQEAAEEIARSQQGVMSVINELKVG
jgi:osmotically-inducible protein OsmY